MAGNDALMAAMRAAEKAALEAQRTDEIYGVQAGVSPIAPWPTEPCRVVFLDFDGVLNSEQSVDQSGTRYRFARLSVAALNELLRQSGAYIVITSSWREHWTLRENAEYLERDGVLPGRVLGRTPALGGARGLEIDAWLRKVPYRVTSYVILDDRDDMAMHGERLVQVSPRVGLTMILAQQAAEVLARHWD